MSVYMVLPKDGGDEVSADMRALGAFSEPYGPTIRKIVPRYAPIALRVTT